MKGRSIPIAVAVLILAAGGFAWHMARRMAASTNTVAALLPGDTIGFAHLPDLNRVRGDWKRSDIYQLYTEPAVQDFLRHPSTSRHGSSAETARELEQLAIRDLFVAVPATAGESMPAIVAGFRFHGQREAVEKVLSKWLPSSGTRETIRYEGHEIERTIYGTFLVAKVYVGEWFFSANSIEDLKALLDRIDRRNVNPASLLSASHDFQSAMAEMPSNYALAFYLRPEAIAARLGAGTSDGPLAPSLWNNVRVIAATSRFENGKVHDQIFAATADSNQSATLSRDSIALSTADTFLYAASLVNLTKGIATVQPTAGAGLLGGFWQKMMVALARASVTADDWQAAFGSETGVLADWPATAHWPSGVAVFPVKNAAKAKTIATALVHALDEDATWIETDRGGAHYITMQGAPGFLTLRPSVAVLDNIMIVGLDPGSVDSAVQRSHSSSSTLSNSNPYKSATATVAAPTTFFAYLDFSLLYARIDASLRPVLLMGAAFMPAVNNYVDLARLPAVEVVTKHLSPIVTSQRRVHDGYMAESVGPVTLNDAGLALVLFSITQRNAWALPMPLHVPTGKSVGPRPGKGLKSLPGSSAVPGATP